MIDLLRSQAKNHSIGTLILTHGAGAPMDSAFMEQLTAALNAVDIDVVRFEFPYMQQRRATGRKRPPDRQAILLDYWQKVYQQVMADGTEKPVCIGGKSMGGRMASLYACQENTIAGVCCFGYPFFPGGKYKSGRIEHLLTAATPTLIVQGTRDPFGKPEIIEPLNLSAAIELCWLEAGDHNFKPTVRSGIEHRQHIQTAAQAVQRFFLSLKEH
ncbi:alpha/beta hydrolase [Porticoccus sp. W117]|uniref:alpha/beta family hydrolase n=1 Tax=Porticoccus sp. W117 TaxID=3054777 RepID=UPI002591D52B|nr:alpha/beta family hydrolase [Porticoccus sp. W117]MDM3872631.1 alpha/beta hydrolase [Porticoccus sp. W117]